MATIDFDNTTGPQVRPTKLAHVVLRTRDKTAMSDFYRDFLGGRVCHENPVLAFITYDDEHHRIALAQVPTLKPKDRNACGLEHIAFTFASLPELFLAYRQRKAKGMLPFWCVHHGVTISIYYHDPDGNILETQYDVFPESEAADEFMRSPAFEENPIGADFDPEEFIARIQGGESLPSLTKRPDIGPRGIDSVPQPAIPASAGS